MLYGVNAFRLCDWEELKHALKHASVKERTKIVLERQARLAKIREVRDQRACKCSYYADGRVRALTAGDRASADGLGDQGAPHAFVRDVADADRP